MKVREIGSRMCEMEDIDANYCYRGIYIDIFILGTGLRWWVWFSEKCHALLYYMSRNKCFCRYRILRAVTTLMYGVIACADGLMRRLAEIFSRSEQVVLCDWKYVLYRVYMPRLVSPTNFCNFRKIAVLCSSQYTCLFVGIVR